MEASGATDSAKKNKGSKPKGKKKRGNKKKVADSSLESTSASEDNIDDLLHDGEDDQSSAASRRASQLDAASKLAADILDKFGTEDRNEDEDVDKENYNLYTERLVSSDDNDD